MRILQYEDYWKMGSDDFQPGDAIVAKVVLVLGYDNDYSVYVAPSTDSTDEELINEGDKVLFQRKVAEGMFSTAAYEKYARG